VAELAREPHPAAIIHKVDINAITAKSKIRFLMVFVCSTSKNIIPSKLFEYAAEQYLSKVLRGLFVRNIKDPLFLVPENVVKRVMDQHSKK